MAEDLRAIKTWARARVTASDKIEAFLVGTTDEPIILDNDEACEVQGSLDALSIGPYASEHLREFFFALRQQITAGQPWAPRPD